MKVRHECKSCMWFHGEVMTCDGEVVEDNGICMDPKAHRGAVEADDWCVNFALAKWAKRREAEGGAE